MLRTTDVELSEYLVYYRTFSSPNIIHFHAILCKIKVIYSQG